MDATSGDNALPAECTPVTLSFQGEVARIYLEATGARVAILISSTISRLLTSYSVTLTATVCGKKSKPIIKRSREHNSSAATPRHCPVRIIVYGIHDEKDAISDALSKDGLFLQHPGETEFDQKVTYINPQYLLPPGEDMPRIEDLAISTCCAVRAPKSDPLGELERNQILQIFDFAYKSSIESMTAIEPSPRLVTRLKRCADPCLVAMAITNS